jgi:hypothetical protein
MGQAAKRRGFGALVAIAMAVLPALVQPITAGATATGTLFAIVSDAPSTISSIDPVTGATTTVANLSAPGLPGGKFLGGLASDPYGHRLFLSRLSQDRSETTSFLYTIDSGTGAASFSTLSRFVSSLVFDTSSSTLLGISRDKYIVQINPGTGAMTNLAALSGDVFEMVVVPASHTLYIESSTLAANQLFSFNTLTNTLTAGPVLPRVRLAYDTSLGVLFGLTLTSPSQLVRIDPVSGVETPVGNAALTFGSGLTIDSFSHTIFVSHEVNSANTVTQFVESINVQTGAKSTSGPLPIPGNSRIYALAFEPIQVTYASLCSLTVQFITSSPAFEGSPAVAVAQGNQLCALLNSAQFAPDQKSLLIAAYQAGLPYLVASALLTPDQAVLLLALSQAL